MLDFELLYPLCTIRFFLNSYPTRPGFLRISIWPDPVIKILGIRSDPIRFLIRYPVNLHDKNCNFHCKIYKNRQLSSEWVKTRSDPVNLHKNVQFSLQNLKNHQLCQSPDRIPGKYPVSGELESDPSRFEKLQCPIRFYRIQIPDTGSVSESGRGPKTRITMPRATYRMIRSSSSNKNTRHIHSLYG